KEYPEAYTLPSDSAIKAIELDQLAGFELTAKSSEYPEEELYQVLLFDQDGGYFLFVGTYQAGNEQALKDIKNIVQTFKRRQ
ncbi:MAG: hypothetical protein AAF985_14755, partial [Bacteroidota bacterium]